MNSPAPTDSRTPFRILCVDDEPDILEILKAVLGMEYEVVTARDGMEALAMLDPAEPDFVLCDVRMPKMDGFDTVRAIRKHPRFFDLPVFFLTAEVRRERAKEGYAAGGNLYLTKPFDPARVMQNIAFFLTESGAEPRPKRLSAEEAQRAARSGGSQASAAESAPGAPRVIVATLEPAQKQAAEEALAEEFECVASDDPASALRQLFEYEPDLLVMNPNIPGISGWGVLQSIRGHRALRALPILLFDDPDAEIEPRFLPAVTKFPLLSAGASPAEIKAAVARVVDSDAFRVRPKSASLETLRERESEAVREMRERAAREDQDRERVAARYRRIQEFIDGNL